MTWPAVFDGIGALFVRCDNDPDVQAARIPGLSWFAPKVGGDDASPDEEIRSWAARMWQPGRASGVWVYCSGPPRADVTTARHGSSLVPIAFVVYDVEAEYKRDEPGGHYEWAAQLVAQHRAEFANRVPAAVTSYGGYKTSIDFGAFAAAGWPILAQCYDIFKPGDEASYWQVNGGVYPNPTGLFPNVNPQGVHSLLRSLKLKPGQAVYRPESIDG